MKEARIISLLPSATEIVYALGLGDQMVGRSHACDYPEPAKELPACTEAGLKTTGSSKAIDRDVKRLLEQATSVFKINAEKIKSLKPTHIITQSQCELCAITTNELQQRLRDYIEAENIKLIDVRPQTLEHVLADFVKIGVALGDFQAGYLLRMKIANEIQSIRMRCLQFVDKPKVALIEWIEPMMKAGLWTDELIEAAAGKNIFENQKEPHTGFDQLKENDPDKIIFIPCGFDIPKTKKELDILFKDAKWADLQAFKNKEIYVSDGSRYFNRPGPRLLESLEILTEIFHPEDFEKKHKKTNWINYF